MSRLLPTLACLSALASLPAPASTQDAAPPAGPPFPILGTLLGPDYRPLPDHLVEASPLLVCSASRPELDLIEQLPAALPPVFQTTTDAQGRFQLRLPEFRPYVVTAAHPSLGTDGVAATPSPDVAHRLMLATPETIDCWVHEREGIPQAGRRVLIATRWTAEAQGYQLHERHTGALRRQQLAGFVDRRPHHVLMPEDEAGGTLGHSLGRPLDRALHLQLRTAQTGTAIPNAAVTVLGGSFYAQGRTDTDGNLDLPLRQVPNFQVSIRARGYPVQRLEALMPEDDQPLRLELGGLTTTTGTVVAGRESLPANVEVAWIGAGGSIAESLVPAQGDFQLFVPAAGQGVLVARAEGMTAVRGDLAPTQPASSVGRLHLRPGLPLTGRVLGPDGQGLGPVRLRITPKHPDPAAQAALDWMTPGLGDLQTLADGSFVIPDLPHGPEYLVRADHPGYAPHEQVLQGTGHRGLAIALRPLCRVEGTVLTPDGDPVGQAQVVLEWREGPALQQSRAHDGTWDWPVKRGLRTVTDAAGRFQFPLAPSGEVTIRAAFPPYLPLRHTVTLAAGGRRSLELALPKGQKVRARIETRSGQPVPGITVILNSAGWSSFEDRTATTNTSGEHLFEHLPPGKYQVICGSPLGWNRLPIELGADHVYSPRVVTLHPPGDD